MGIRIKNALFDGFTTTGSGSVLNIESRNIFIVSSSFFNCKASEEGGCIYAVSSSILIRSSEFYKCSSTKHTNEKNGNIMFSQNTKRVIIDCINSRLSGESSSCCSDSSIKIIGDFCRVTSYNASDNYGVGGASLICIWSSKEGSTLKFLQDIRGYDYFCIDSTTKQVLCMYTNFVDSQPSSRIVYSDPEEMILFRNCVFIGLTKQLFNKKCDFIDCISDTDYSQYMNTVNSGEAVTFQIFFDKYDSCKYNSINKKRIHLFIAILFTV